MDGKPINHQGREGGVLAMALMIVTVLGLSSGAAVLSLRGFLRAGHEAQQRALARRAMQVALHDLARTLALDTNGWDAADASWMRAAEIPSQIETVTAWIDGPSWRADSVAGLVDAESRIGINTVPEDWLRRLFEHCGLEPDAARTLSASVVAWRGPPSSPDDHATGSDAVTVRADPADDDAWHPEGQPLRCLEMLRLMPGGAGLDLDRLRPLATVHGSGRLNVNTASRMVLRLTLASLAGRDSDVPDRLIRRIETARRHGRVLRQTTPAAMAETFGAAGALRPDEMTILARLLEMDVISVQSTAVEGDLVGAVPDAQGHPREQLRVAFVWDRARGRIVYWREK